MGTYSVTIETALVQAIFLQLPAAAKDTQGSVTPAMFMPSMSDPSKGTLTVDGQFEAVVGQILATPNLQSVFLNAYAAKTRYFHSTSGVNINGLSVLTDSDSQNLINGAVNLVMLDPTVTSIDFKSPSGYVEMSAAQIVTIGKAVGVFIQQCFSAEKAVLAKIASGEYRTTDDIDNASEWPSTTITTS